MKRIIVLIFLLNTVIVNAQPSNKLIMQGNDAYRKGDFSKAVDAYKNALRIDPGNNAARFNLANALQRQNETKQSQKLYDDIIEQKEKNDLHVKALYNKGLSLAKEKKLEDAAHAFMMALTIDPNDNDTRENLQLVLNEMRKQNPLNQNQSNKKIPQKIPPATKELIEQKLNELRNQEKQLQKRLQKQSGNGQPEKDW